MNQSIAAGAPAACWWRYLAPLSSIHDANLWRVLIESMLLNRKTVNNGVDLVGCTFSRLVIITLCRNLCHPIDHRACNAGVKM